MRMYLDACAIIYAIEGVKPFRDEVLDRIAKFQTAGGDFVTSRLALFECRVKPLRDRDAALLTKYDGFFGNSRLEIAELSASVITRATELRAEHGFKTPDAIHLATALEIGATSFLTGDRGFARFTGMRFEIVT